MEEREKEDNWWRSILKDIRTPYIPKNIFVADLDENEDNETVEMEDEEDIQIGDEVTETEIKEDLLTQKTNKNMETVNEIVKTKKEIEDFLNQDFESEGQQDAFANSDRAYADSNKELLKSKFGLKFSNTVTAYEDKIKDCDASIQKCQTNGMTENEAEFKVEKDKIAEAKSVFVSQKSEMEQIIVRSYDKGFQKGILAIIKSNLGI